MKKRGCFNSAASFIKHCFLSERITSPVLEIGSGRDEFNRKLFSTKYKVITTNICPNNVVDYICSVACLPFEDNGFGCVICEHVLEHAEDPKKAIAEIFRVLKPGGLLILVTPFRWPLHDKPYDLWRFSEEGLRALLTKHFEKIEFDTIGNPSNPRLYCVTAGKPAPKKQEHHPKVSVIMPTYNRSGMLPRAIESVLKQTYKDWELIVVNDGGADNTAKMMKGYRDPRIKYYEKANGGPASARNLGLRHAQGEYIAYCDDDDTIAPYHLETLANYLNRHPEVGMVRGFALLFPQSQKQGYLKLGFLWDIMHRHRSLKKKIYFDEKQRVGEDIEFILRFSDYYPVRIINVVCASYLRHDRNYTVLKPDSYLKKYNGMRFIKRLRAVCKEQNIKKKYFLMIAYFSSDPAVSNEAFLELARIFYRKQPCLEALYFLSCVYYRLGKNKKSKEILMRIINSQDTDFRENISQKKIFKEYSRGFLSWLNSDSRRYDKSIFKHIARGFGANSRNQLFKLELFHTYLERGMRVKAIQIYRKINDSSLGLYCQGVFFLLDSRYKEAEEQFRKIRKLNHIYQYRLYWALSLLYSQTNRIEQSRTYMEMSKSSGEKTWEYPLFIKSSFSSVSSKKFRNILGRIFLTDTSPDVPIFKISDISYEEIWKKPIKVS